MAPKPPDEALQSWHPSSELLLVPSSVLETRMDHLLAPMAEMYQWHWIRLRICETPALPFCSIWEVPTLQVVGQQGSAIGSMAFLQIIRKRTKDDSDTEL